MSEVTRLAERAKDSLRAGLTDDALTCLNRIIKDEAARTPSPVARNVGLSELLSDVFDFLGGVDDAADLRERLLVELRHDEIAALTAVEGI